MLDAAAEFCDTTLIRSHRGAPAPLVLACLLRFPIRRRVAPAEFLSAAWNKTVRETPSVGPSATPTPRCSGGAGCQATPPGGPSQRLDDARITGSGGRPESPDEWHDVWPVTISSDV